MKPRQPQHQHGVALVLTLTILALVLILLMAFVVSMRTERAAAKGYTDYLKAKLLADAAVNDAVAILRQGTPLQTNDPPTTFWTAPGLALTNQNGVFGAVNLYTETGNPLDTWVNLNSVADGMKTNYIITGTNSVIAAGTNGIWAQWINLSANGLPPNATRPIVGRFAYWIDDEATKVNINSAYARDPSLPAPFTSSTNNSLLSEVSLDALQEPFSLSSLIADSVKNARTNTFNSAQEIRRVGNGASITWDGYSSNQFYLTAFSVETNTDTWGRPRIDLNGLAAADVSTLSTAYGRFNDDIYKNIYVGMNIFSNSFVKKYSSGNVLQMLANIIDYRQPASAPATHDGGIFTLNSQIPQEYCGLKKGPFLNEIIFHAMHTNVIASIITDAFTGVITTNWNVTVSVLADVELINPFPDAKGANWEVLIEPQSISYDIYQGSLLLTATNDIGPRPGLLSSTFTNWYPTVAGSVTPVTMNLGSPIYRTAAFPIDISGYSYRTFANTNVAGSFLPANWKYVPKWVQTTLFSGSGTIANEAPGVQNVTIQMNHVILRQTQTDPNSIRDWATSIGPGGRSDFPAGGFVIPLSLLWDISPINAPANADDPIERWLRISDTTNPSFDKNALGIAKNDPRMRTFGNVAPLGTVTNWIPTFILANSGGGDFRVTPGTDNAPGINDHRTQRFVSFLLPDGRERGQTTPEKFLASTFYISESEFQSPAELGFIHVGVPWRTLRMQSIVAVTNSLVGGSTSPPAVPLNAYAETNSIPDWVLLDIFTAGTAISAVGRLNINSSIFGSNDFRRTPGALPPRVISMAALTFGMDSTPLSSTNYLPVNTTSFWWGTTTNAFQPSSTNVNSRLIGTNIGWSHDTNIPQTALSGLTQTNCFAADTTPYGLNPLFLTPGEIVEIKGVDGALTTLNPPNGTGPRDADKELIPRKIANLITTRSNAFTIWAVAQAIKKVGGDPATFVPGTDLITGEVRVQAVVERYVDHSTTPPTVRFRTNYYRYIYE